MWYVIIHTFILKINCLSKKNTMESATTTETMMPTVKAENLLTTSNDLLTPRSSSYFKNGKLLRLSSLDSKTPK